MSQVINYIKKLWFLNWELKLIKKRPKIIFMDKGKTIEIGQPISLRPLGEPITPNPPYKVQPHNRSTIPPDCMNVISTEDGLIHGPFQIVQVGETEQTGVFILGANGR